MAGESRIAVVTGASAGIGAAVARALGAAGCQLAVGSRRPDRLEAIADELRAGGAEVFAQRLDVGDAASVDAFFDASEKSLGPASIVVNNAGVSRPAPFHEYDVDWIETEVATNFLGPILVSRRAITALRERGQGGDLLFMTSDAVKRPRPQQALYSAAKAGIENLATALAYELEGTGIRVTKIRIGPTLTEFGNEWGAERIGEQMEYWRPFGLRDARLLGTMLSPEDVAHAVVEVVRRPPGVWIDTVEIQPAAPKRED